MCPLRLQAAFGTESFPWQPPIADALRHVEARA
jgi:hypothetical protein